jgi:CheY-like chemotaxis protein
METNKSGTILIVEDEPGVRDVAAQMLKFTGFSVIEAIDAQSGLEKFYQNPDIDLVFSDVIMTSGTSGIEMAKEMLAQKTSNSHSSCDRLLCQGRSTREHGSADRPYWSGIEALRYQQNPHTDLGYDQQHRRKINT